LPVNCLLYLLTWQGSGFTIEYPPWFIILELFYSISSSNSFFFVQDYNKIHVVNSTSNVWVGRSGCSCKLVKHDLSLNFMFACNVLRHWFGVLPSYFIDFTSKALLNSLESLL